jgi:cystathionine beta-lyase/cystathionine gamma-synthase
MTVPSITPSQVRIKLLLRDEIALLDVRHEAAFATGHPLFAANMAAERIALEAATRLPRKDVPIVSPKNNSTMGETAYSNSICVCTDRTTRSKAALARRPARLLWRPYRLLCARRDRGQFDVSSIDQSDEVALSAGFEKKPALTLIETPSNPLPV